MEKIKAGFPKVTNTSNSQSSVVKIRKQVDEFCAWLFAGATSHQPVPHPHARTSRKLKCLLQWVGNTETLLRNGEKPCLMTQVEKNQVRAFSWIVGVEDKQSWPGCYFPSWAGMRGKGCESQTTASLGLLHQEEAQGDTEHTSTPTAKVKAITGRGKPLSLNHPSTTRSPGNVLFYFLKEHKWFKICFLKEKPRRLESRTCNPSKATFICGTKLHWRLTKLLALQPFPWRGYVPHWGLEEPPTLLGQACDN